MPKPKVDRKNLKVIEGSKPAPNRPEGLLHVNGTAHGQRTSPTDPARFTADLVLWPVGMMCWWMPRTG